MRCSYFFTLSEFSFLLLYYFYITSLSDMKPIKTRTAEQQLQHAAARTCKLCYGQFTKKKKKTKHHCHLSGLYIDPYCNTRNLKLKYKKGPNCDPTDGKKKKASKKETDQALQRHF